MADSSNTKSRNYLNKNLQVMSQNKVETWANPDPKAFWDSIREEEKKKMNYVTFKIYNNWKVKFKRKPWKDSVCNEYFQHHKHWHSHNRE